MNVVISHGSFGKPHENWIPWLEEELDKKDITYITPTFPTPQFQNYTDWKTVLDLYYNFGLVNSETVFIGHSCGAVFLAKYIIEREIKAKAFFSVAGYNNFISGDKLMDDLNGSFYLNDDELMQISSLVNKRVSFFSDNDLYIPQEKLKEFAKLINANVIIIKNGGHINLATGFNKFVDLLDQINRL
jgi:predicted alpha/beta hydrolase family esterase